MRVLVAFASAHGSTEGIGQALSERLRTRGLEVVSGSTADLDAELTPAVGAAHPRAFDAAVIGSAIHSGRWLPEAKTFVRKVAPTLSGAPVWLFSVCSVGETSSVLGARATRLARSRRRDSAELTELRQLVDCRDHRYFAGVVQKGHWGRLGDLFMMVTGGRHGDYRDWADIDRWADQIAEQLNG